MGSQLCPRSDCHHAYSARLPPVHPFSTSRRMSPVEVGRGTSPASRVVSGRRVERRCHRKPRAAGAR